MTDQAAEKKISTGKKNGFIQPHLELWRLKNYVYLPIMLLFFFVVLCSCQNCVSVFNLPTTETHCFNTHLLPLRQTLWIDIIYIRMMRMSQTDENCLQMHIYQSAVSEADNRDTQSVNRSPLLGWGGTAGRPFTIDPYFQLCNEVLIDHIICIIKYIRRILRNLIILTESGFTNYYIYVNG